ncbi:MAG: hypothetical protein Kow0059_10570 [Candidatus Sumerlaeia bacterium]
MNILYLCCDPGIPVFGRKGCSTHVRETCRTLANLGHKVVVASPNPGPDRPPRLPFEFFRLPMVSRRVPCSDFRLMLNNVVMLRALNGLLRRFRPEAIYERHALYSVVGERLEKQLGIPRILEINTRLAQENRSRLHFPRLADWSERRIFQKARRVIVISKPLHDFLISLGKDEQHVKIIPIGVDPDLFNPSVDGDAVRRDLNLTSGVVVIGYLGAFNYYHRFDLMLPLVRRLNEAGHAVKVLAVGGDTHKIEKFKRRIQDMGLTEQFHFTGAVPYENLPSYIAAMDFAVVPGHTPVATPTKIFEFGAMAKACVAPDHIPIRALMADGAEDLVFTPDDLESLFEKVMLLLTKPARRDELAQALHRNILSRHTWDQHIREILKIYQDM